MILPTRGLLVVFVSSEGWFAHLRSTWVFPQRNLLFAFCMAVVPLAWAKSMSSQLHYLLCLLVPEWLSPQQQLNGIICSLSPQNYAEDCKIGQYYVTFFPCIVVINGYFCIFLIWNQHLVEYSGIQTILYGWLLSGESGVRWAIFTYLVL